jgi:Kdo2-lipid IVA lauroyltransferase/acyltransferase
VKLFAMIFFRFLSRLPLTVLYGIANVLYILLAHVIRYRRRVVLNNLQQSFPDKSTQEISRLARGFYRNLADLIVEIIKLPAMQPQDLKRRVVYTNPEIVLNYLRQGQSVIALGGHQCNWEWIPSAAVLYDMPVDSVYKTLENPKFETLMREIRATFGPYLVPMTKLPRELVARKNRPRVLALVADQVPDKPEFAHWLPFLNRETPFYPGSERLARSQKMPVVYMEMVRLRRGYYTATFTLLAEPPYDTLPPGQIIENYRNLLQASITRHPADWLWSHKRWKHTTDEYAGRFWGKVE